MNGQAFLSETAGLIERGSCCGADARDRKGNAVAASHPTATAWSLLGALVAVSEGPRMLADAKTSLEEHPPPLAGWTDDS